MPKTVASRVLAHFVVIEELGTMSYAVDSTQYRLVDDVEIISSVSVGSATDAIDFYSFQLEA